MAGASRLDAAVTLASLLPETEGTPAGASRLSGLSLDSRRVGEGEAFIAIPGEHHDGRNYLAAAAASGASVLLVEAGISELQRRAAGDTPLLEVEGLASRLGEIAAGFFGRPAEAMRMVGITGTNGKTTTSRLLAQLLRSQGSPCGVVGTLGATLGNEVETALNTTPDAISLQSTLAAWRDQGVQSAVLEVSSHSLSQGRVNGIPFELALFTNLSHDHLDYHGDMEAYGRAKASLFQLPGLRLAILNADDPYSEQIASQCEHLQVWRYGLSAAADVKPFNVEYHAAGVRAELETPWGTGRLDSPLVGQFNLSNLLAALTAACALGMPLPEALAQVPALEGAAGRMEAVPNEAGLQVIVDYSHTPDALEQALAALRVHTAGELWCVFGCGGNRDPHKRPVMGRIARAGADRVVVTSDNPRREDPKAIVADVLAGCDGDVIVEVDRASAIAHAIGAAQPGDCILIAGKGHETYQEVAGERLPFDDAKQARLALAGVVR
jgi:UDP-N-acetylmuramoyl-L-alanyl-D-glutamate--2,6-diaminopimelate ligase